MKNPLHLLLTSLAFLLIGVTACKKANQSEAIPAELAASDDQVQVTAEFDAVLEDANQLIRDSSTFDFNNAKRQLCDASFTVNTTAETKTITVTYNGNNCGARNRTRVGTMILSMPVAADWEDAGAVINMSIQNLKIRRVSDQSSITLNGNTVITNLSGGNVAYLDSIGPVTHTITGNGISIKFPNDSTRNWNISKQRVYSYEDGMVISTSGTHTEGNMTGVAEWGLNRAGEIFHTRIDQPVIIREGCLFKVTGGTLSYNTTRTMIITYGLDLRGNVAGCPGYFPYYYKTAFTDLQDKMVNIIARY